MSFKLYDYIYKCYKHRFVCVVVGGGVKLPKQFLDKMGGGGVQIS